VRLPLYSLRTGIMAQLVFLIIAAMLLIHVAELKFSESNLIQARVQACRMLVLALEENIGVLLTAKGMDLRNVCRDPIFMRSMSGLLSKGGFADGVLIDFAGDVCGHGAGRGDEQILGLATEALKTSTWNTRLTGTTWGVIWLGPRDLVVSSPLLFQDRTIGAVAFRSSLAPIYETLRGVQKIVIAYILLDTLVLTLVGILLLSRIVVKPIRKMLKMASEYRDGRMIPFAVESSTNEIGELSRSLAAMLKRLDENKSELQAHITSLERANADLQQAQSNLVRSEKLASVGRLAAGIAHEIGNPISISLGYLELLKKTEVEEEERRDFLDRLEMEVSRISRIIRQLLDFSRPSSAKPEKTHVHDVLKKTMTILKPQPMMEGIEVRLQPGAADDLLIADPNRLQQVFVNIVMNAADALADGSGTCSGGREKLLLIRTWNDEVNFTVEFADTGPGIPQEELAHIFDPFYTTKEPGKGTGLGLSVCYRIVESMGGLIKAESRKGQGASFTVTLPSGLKEE
jgi:two-component system, NtrC family, sensor kinase